MKNPSLTLYLEINNLSYIFFVGEIDKNDNLRIVYKLKLPLTGIQKNRIFNLEEVYILIKKNIYFVEQKLNYRKF